jgi:hypothetical protein
VERAQAAVGLVAASALIVLAILAAGPVKGHIDPPELIDLPSLSGGNAQPDRACWMSNVSVANDQTDAIRSSTPNDVQLAAGAGGVGTKRAFFGMNAPFTRINLDVGTAGEGGRVHWYYSRGQGTWGELEVTDTTDSFTRAGVGQITFSPPEDWATAAVGGSSSPCPWTHYWVMARTLTGDEYTTVPLGSQATITSFNLQLRVVDDVGDPVDSLSRGDFAASTGGASSTVYASRQISAGTYQIGLNVMDGPTAYSLQVRPGTLLSTATVATGTLSTTLTILQEALESRFPLRVDVYDNHDNPRPDATVRVGDRAPIKQRGSTYYFESLAQGRLTVTRSGYEPFNTSADTAAADVHPGTTTPTTVRLRGTVPCVGSTVAAGATATCRGLIWPHDEPPPPTESTTSGTPPTSPTSTTVIDPLPDGDSGLGGGDGGSRTARSYMWLHGLPWAPLVAAILLTASGVLLALWLRSGPRRPKGPKAPR